MELLHKKYLTNLNSPHSRREILGLAILEWVNFDRKFSTSEIATIVGALKLEYHEAQHFSQFGPSTELVAIELNARYQPYFGTKCDLQLAFNEEDPTVALSILSAPGEFHMTDNDKLSASLARSRMPE